MKPTLPLLAGLFLAAASTLTAHASNIVTFGTGSNQFSIEFVPIDNPGNADDIHDQDIYLTPGIQTAGGVGYSYQVGKFEISRDMITKSNAEGSLGITLSDMTSRGGNGADRPATGVSWFEAASS